ncbi:hypothetical protein, partial [Salmonella sp. s51228]|uniref:hypothetical protein n=1 Tax=Salmonella sp. s51228 TaxID=3159652 RepID=UPI00397FC36A
MSKNKERMGHRYIELFLESKPDTRPPSRMRGGSRNIGATYYSGYEDEPHHSSTGAYYMPSAYSSGHSSQLIPGTGAYPKPLISSST